MCFYVIHKKNFSNIPVVSNYRREPNLDLGWGSTCCHWIYGITCLIFMIQLAQNFFLKLRMHRLYCKLFCAVDWMLVFPLKHIGWNLFFNVTVSGYMTLKEDWGMRVEPSWMQLIHLWKRLQRVLLSLPPREHKTADWIKSVTWQFICQHLDPGFLVFRVMRNKVLSFVNHPVAGVLL